VRVEGSRRILLGHPSHLRLSERRWHGDRLWRGRSLHWLGDRRGHEGECQGRGCQGRGCQGRGCQGLRWYAVVCGGMWYAVVCASKCSGTLVNAVVCGGMWWYVVVYGGMWWYTRALHADDGRDRVVPCSSRVARVAPVSSRVAPVSSRVVKRWTDPCKLMLAPGWHEARRHNVKSQPPSTKRALSY
jgi:hypothetical protein